MTSRIQLLVAFSGLLGCHTTPNEARARDTDVGTSTDASSGESGAEDTDDEPEFAPSAPGPYSVGVETVVFHDEARGRELVTEIWYPAQAREGAEPVTVYSENEILTPGARDALDALGERFESELESSAERAAPPLRDEGPFPVVFFSHGSGGTRVQSLSYTTVLASHGFVVVAPDHVGNTLSDVIVSGPFETSDLLVSLGERTLDLAFVRGELERSESVAASSGMLDLERVGVSGHSFGGLTSLRWMAQGGDVDAVVAQVPPGMSTTWIGISSSLASFDVPLLLQLAGQDSILPIEEHGDTIWSAASAPRARMLLEEAGHYTYSDMCEVGGRDLELLERLGLRDTLADGCSGANVTPEIAGLATRHYAIAFFERFLRGDVEGARLDEEAGKAIVGDAFSWAADL